MQSECFTIDCVGLPARGRADEANMMVRIHMPGRQDEDELRAAVDVCCVVDIVRAGPPSLPHSRRLWYLLSFVRLIASTAVVLWSGYRNVRVLYAKRTRLLVCLSPEIKDSRVLSVIGARAVRKHVRQRQLRETRHRQRRDEGHE